MSEVNRKSNKRSIEDVEGTHVPQSTDVPIGHGRPTTTANVELQERVQVDHGAHEGEPFRKEFLVRKDWL